MFLLSAGAFFFTFFQYSSFGIIGENVALYMRKELYTSILQKHMGWFDHIENTPGVLSATLASEAQTINGVVAGGLVSTIQAIFSIMAVIAIGFTYNWKISLVCLGCVPFMVLGGIINMKFQQGLSSNSEELMKDANLIAGDSIIHYRTVASFANEDQIIRDYSRMLEGPVRAT